ncbi:MULTISPECIES: hypothetical protein [Pseudoalteromonas]|uniref:Uncharacterized protein n=1 Tax=Pseudoalteromonas amylolytica TaxID=1859457 RepID=A0A1S1MVW7_9GAMM|nr:MULTISPECIES: hypothetical protein [Pseudoalteromonas]OHU85510.1 hypothetical protein BFC16_19370 [Pseudoalteromonas sp. JW3]OHU91744.1 hypothetical protein BET10_08065 [Pseudoalteromonas amylolytica]
MLKKLLLPLTAAVLSINAAALTPLEDRARVSRMNADLLLPDGSTLNVDVSFDCGSDYKNTALMVMSDSGAQLLAAAYTHLYGVKAGEQVMTAWNTKKNNSDPRKPTYLFVLAERTKSFNWQNSQSNTNKLNRNLKSVTMNGAHVENYESISSEQYVPVVVAGCGVRDHNPYEVN